MSVEFNGLSSSYGTSQSVNNNKGAAKMVALQPLDDENTSTESKFSEAIRLYRNYTLTGEKELSSDEKKEIKGLIENYLEENNFLEKYKRNQKTRKDYAGLNDFIKGLYKQFGAKSDYYEFVTDFVNGTLEKVVDPNNPPRPPFSVETPPELALENKSKKPMLMPFQSPSPHQFLMGDDNS